MTMAKQSQFCSRIPSLFLLLLACSPVPASSSLSNWFETMREPTPVDLYLLVDSSQAVTMATFTTTVKKFMLHLVQDFVDVSPDQTRIAVLLFGDGQPSVPLNSVSNVRQQGSDIIAREFNKCDLIQDALWNTSIQYLNPSTDTYESPAELFDKLLEGSSRSDVAKQVVLLLTSGHFNAFSLSPGEYDLYGMLMDMAAGASSGIHVTGNQSHNFGTVHDWENEAEKQPRISEFRSTELNPSSVCPRARPLCNNIRGYCEADHVASDGSPNNSDPLDGWRILIYSSPAILLVIIFVGMGVYCCLKWPETTKKRMRKSIRRARDQISKVPGLSRKSRAAGGRDAPAEAIVRPTVRKERDRPLPPIPLEEIDKPTVAVKPTIPRPADGHSNEHIDAHSKTEPRKDNQICNDDVAHGNTQQRKQKVQPGIVISLPGDLNTVGNRSGQLGYGNKHPGHSNARGRTDIHPGNMSTLPANLIRYHGDMNRDPRDDGHQEYMNQGEINKGYRKDPLEDELQSSTNRNPGYCTHKQTDINIPNGKTIVQGYKDNTTGGTKHPDQQQHDTSSNLRDATRSSSSSCQSVPDMRNPSGVYVNTITGRVAPPSLHRPTRPASMLKELEGMPCEPYQDAPLQHNMVNWLSYVSEAMSEGLLHNMGIFQHEKQAWITTARAFIFSRTELALLRSHMQQESHSELTLREMVYSTQQNTGGTCELHCTCTNENLHVAMSRDYVVAVCSVAAPRSLLQFEVNSIKEHLVALGM